MDINITLLGQMLTFGVLILVIYRCILPALRSVLEQRQKEINDGIAAGRLGQQNLRKSAELIENQMIATQKESNMLIERAKRAADKIIQEAQAESEKLRDRYLAEAEKQLEYKVQLAKHELIAGDSERVALALRQLLAGGAGGQDIDGKKVDSGSSDSQANEANDLNIKDGTTGNNRRRRGGGARRATVAALKRQIIQDAADQI